MSKCRKRERVKRERVKRERVKRWKESERGKIKQEGE